METLKGPLAEALARHREELNARFAARQVAGDTIGGPSFLEHLAATVAPIVEAVERVLPERADAVALALYDLSLELFAKQWLGPEAKDPVVRIAWQTVLPRAALPMAREAGRVAGSVSNAVINLAGTPGARTAEWIARMADMAPRCTAANTLLQCGKVLAWQAGMAHYRDGALTAAGQLDASLAAAAMGLPTDLSADALAETIERLRGDPWLLPSEAMHAGETPRKLGIVSQAGGFRGFGGPFMRPPKVRVVDDQFAVTDGEKHWRLLADAFGAVFVRSEPVVSSVVKSAITGDKSGNVQWSGDTARFPELSGASSFACDGHTLAVTLERSHLVFLIAQKQMERLPTL